MASKYLQKFPIPAGFQQILSDFTKQVLRDQPSNIIQYASQYFEMLEKGKKLQFNSKFNVKKDDKKYQLSYNPKNAQDITKKAANITQKINQRQVHNQEEAAQKVVHIVAPQVHQPVEQHTAPVHVPQEKHQTPVIGTEKTVTGQQTGNYINHLSQEVAQHEKVEQLEAEHEQVQQLEVEHQKVQHEQDQENQPQQQTPGAPEINQALKSAVAQAVDIVFQKYDTNKSGFLQSKQINNFLKEVVSEMNEGVSPQQEEIQEFVRQVDNDHDGKLSRAEMQKFVCGLMGI